jgi:hypothetical protein
MVTTIPIEESWLNRLRKEGYTKDTIFDDGQYEDLKSKLLSYGGEAVILPAFEDDYDKIMTRGIPLLTFVTKMVRGRPSQCHANCADLWSAKGLSIMTGYSLSDDGVWRQHTWCMGNGVVIETTEKREAYFGFLMTDKEAEIFSFENY